jgi:hypothetical protein
MEVIMDNSSTGGFCSLFLVVAIVGLTCVYILASVYNIPIEDAFGYVSGVALGVPLLLAGLALLRLIVVGTIDEIRGRN